MERLEDMSEPEQQALLTILVRHIEETLTDMGFEVPQFALLLFNDHREGRYFINCIRSELIQALQQAADWFEHREHRGWRKRKSLAGPWRSGHHKGPPRGRGAVRPYLSEKEVMQTRLFQVPSDPAFCRISAGSCDGWAHYCIFCGEREEVAKCLRRVLGALEDPAHPVEERSDSYF